MQEREFNTQGLTTRVSEVAKELRKSEAYPAIVGGVAGGIAGAMMAAIIAGRKASVRPQVDATIEASPRSRFNVSVKDMMQLMTVVAALAKQVQSWKKKQEE
ncbi:MAG: hypothetical protein HZB51_09535 [Chloroflexi bacterium]|nr:hypothetical protein [Chloroflexota bacterium]